MMNKRITQVLLLLLIAAGIALAVVYREQLSGDALQEWVISLGSAGPVVFMLIYIVSTLVFLPGSVLTLAGGALFGPVWGTFYNLTGATIGATLAFIIARYIASEWVEKNSGKRVAKLKEGVEAEGWRFVAFVRLVPLFPFNLLNYALGLTRIRLLDYILATYLFMLPGGFAYTYLGYAGREAISGGESFIQKGLLALALLAVVAFIPRLVGRLRQGPMIDVSELAKQLKENDPPLILDVRTVEDYVGKQGYIIGSFNIPLEELKQRIAEISDHNDSPVAIVCRTDKRSVKAARILARNGFSNVHVVRNGMTAWNSAGEPVSHEPPV
ncbi:sulfurtransferase [Solemya velum gill symbiont]|uniref:TVP38/TMEM64 family membrane protein n=4 Tax=Solemya velum gill symbiont TaxID=2340 RepID=A0A1T2DRP5_SOVGS|nr:sulfurtransferase [Solemya velum gill symbiont]OOY37674.1 sulfurtransferase [Solemya velum gill symbiont]OOY39788.1 sulfurtransferase [Solemya velum gill symbiont]OOY46772.1 sulfurtransferase [Solemya velum gill symbiont]OOY49726.1 sulfurtransferase [Solemya velum gill symbiont]